MRKVEEFPSAVDRAWPSPEVATIETPFPLKIIGSAALMLQTPHERGTKDSDVFETIELTPVMKRRLQLIAGKGTAVAVRHAMYIDVVHNGLPFLRQRSSWSSVTTTAAFRCFRLQALDPVDVVVSKLKRLSPNDLVDIEAMVDGGHVAHESVITCFREAVDYFGYDARADDLPEVVANLHRVERDIFGVDETPIALPRWI
ncbi:MAG TPA: DUF6036 family nucleotidyltransferase [Kofleriaceae bacterium]|nr:DUF6036 family nucleotidyltransferase [Kofleriaceae bacterium]